MKSKRCAPSRPLSSALAYPFARQDSRAKKLTLFFLGLFLFIQPHPGAADPIVYSIERQLDLGGGTLSAATISGVSTTATNDEINPKDYYVGIGSAQGVNNGSVLTVLRRKPIYDSMTEKLYRDVEFPIATLKVIHVEKNIAIARLEALLPTAKTPVIQPRAVMLGDRVMLRR